MKRYNFATKIEQILRAICFIFYLFSVIALLFIESWFRPLYPKINKLCGGFFSRNFKLNGPHEYVIQFWESGFLKLYGIDVIVENKDCKFPTSQEDNAIVMFSHGSNLDPPIIHATFPFFVHFVSKKQLFQVPFIGYTMKIIGQIPIDRDNLASAIESLKETGEMIREEQKNVGIAPEGTRRRSESTGPDQLQPFKKGPFHLAKSSKRDIIPVVIMGANRLWPPGQPFPLPGTLVVRYLERIPKEKIEQLTLPELQELVKEKFEKNIDVLDDRVVFSTENKPYGVFIANLACLLGFWVLIVKNFL